MPHYINTYKKYSVSNILIWLSVVFTIGATINPALYRLWMNDYFLDKWDYLIYFTQFFTSNFLHSWIFHLFFNSMFIYYFGNQVELILWQKKYISLFIFNAIFVWVWLTILGEWNTIWISSFCMAILTYFTLDLKSKKIDEYKWWLTAIVINIVIWLNPQISLMWHLLWVIAWIIFYYINKTFFKRVLTPI